MKRIIEINKNTASYKRMEIAGFKIKNCYSDCFHSTSGELYHEDIVSVSFECVCGKVERAIKLFDSCRQYFTPQYHMHRVVIDAAKLIEDIGALSEEHLRNDNFSEDEIKYIRRAYAA
jgi:hypothetical protein